MIDVQTGNSARLYAGIAVVLLAFVVGGFIAYRNTRTIRDDAELVTHTHEVLISLKEVLSLTKDAETGQRGFIITGSGRYLEPYKSAVTQIGERLNEIESLVRGNPEQLAQLVPLRAAIKSKLDELQETIDLRRSSGFDAAQAVIVEDRGRVLMNQIREKLGSMEEIERSLRVQRIDEMTKAYHVAIVSVLMTTLIGMCLAAIVGYLLRQTMIRRAQHDWLQQGQLQLAKAMSGEQSYDQLGQNILKFIAEYLDSPVAALFVRDSDHFRRVSTYGAPANNGVPERFDINDGLIGQSARDQRPFFVSDVPDGYLAFGSALGSAKPRSLVVVPVVHDENTTAVMEFGFIGELNDSHQEFFDRVSESIGPAVKSVEYRMGLQNLLEETQRQSEELQAQGEELRVSNEELEEQSRALRESQTRLESQQQELEQINSNLEEQTQLLEIERDQVSRSKNALELQARELKRTSQYKSDFLANMSHELRTPLNSTLILAKLLADNEPRTLTPEQVQFAQTIQTAGNDLLTLINDILDLSKIEAGHMEIVAEPFHVASLLEDLRRGFQPVALQKQLQFEVSASNAPETIVSDRHRLEQILKNLLSNAIKFTERGKVALSVQRTSDNRVSFAVTDTGIGVTHEQQEIIFEAFRQADGTTNRKYGGTGLGLSISRELTRLLRGEIQLTSEENRGSTFTLTIPITYDASGPVETHILPPADPRNLRVDLKR